MNNEKDYEKENKIKKEIEEEEFSAEVGEDTTKYGEFISSYFAWISLPKQKENAERLQEITKKDKKERKKQKKRDIKSKRKKIVFF